MPDKESLRFAIDRFDTIITNADNKASFLLSFATAVFAGSWFTKDYMSNSCNKIILYLCFVFLLLSVLASFLALYPRYNRKVSTTIKNTIFSFNVNISNIQDKEEDYIKQMKNLSTIICHKLFLIRVANMLLITSTLLLFIAFSIEFYT